MSISLNAEKNLISYVFNGRFMLSADRHNFPMWPVDDSFYSAISLFLNWISLVINVLVL